MTSPAPIVPIPAAVFPELRGYRVIVGVPGIGFRGDLRADDPVVQRARTYVPVLPELEYYRAEAQGIEVFAALVPIDRVWVESTQGVNLRADTTPLDAPATREPVPATALRSVLGSRVVQAVPDGFVRQLRAVTDVYLNADGVKSIRICGEADWYQWAIAGEMPQSSEAEARLVWVE